MSVAASFRDPDGFCFQHNGRILRIVRRHAADRVRELIASAHFTNWVSQGHIPATRILPDGDAAAVLAAHRSAVAELGNDGSLVIEQDRVPFVSYPHEWPPEMLYAAAELTLKLQLEALEHGLMLKDATPLNILFDGSRPVFVDVLSFTPRPNGSAVWPAYAQFVRTFILPLLLHRKHGGGTHDVFLTRRDGLEPEEVYARLSRLQRLQSPALSCVSMPTWLGRSKSAETASPATAKPMPESRAKEVAPFLIKGLRRSLRRVRPRHRQSTWSQYMATNTYDAEALKVKEDFVRDALRSWGAKTVLDVGCNTGHFSKLAAESGASVVALDYDSVVVGRVFADAAKEQCPILPLVLNLARPSPAIGWANAETSSFLSRAAGAFDAALLLAVIHHLTVSDGVPLSEVFSLLARIVQMWAVVEFVPPSDPQFQRIVRNKEHLIPLLGREQFEVASQQHFVAEQSRELASGRILYLLRKRAGRA